MALVNCPECGRANVSDSAEMCPSCGYSVRAHFEQIVKQMAAEEEEREAQQAAEVKAEQIRQEKAAERAAIQPLEKKPKAFATVLLAGGIIVTLGAIILICLMAITEIIDDPAMTADTELWLILGVVLFVVGVGLVLCGWGQKYDYATRMMEYNLSHEDLEAYRDLVMGRKNAAAAAEAGRAKQLREQAIARQNRGVRCPYCGAYTEHRISMTAIVIDTAAFGIFGQTRRYQWQCDMCHTKF